MLLTFYHIPSNFNNEMNKSLNIAIYFGILFHLIISIFVYDNKDYFPDMHNNGTSFLEMLFTNNYTYNLSKYGFYKSRKKISILLYPVFVILGIVFLFLIIKFINTKLRIIKPLYLYFNTKNKDNRKKDELIYDVINVNHLNKCYEIKKLEYKIIQNNEENQNFPNIKNYFENSISLIENKIAEYNNDNNNNNDIEDKIIGEGSYHVAFQEEYNEYVMDFLKKKSEEIIENNYKSNSSKTITNNNK